MARSPTFPPLKIKDFHIAERAPMPVNSLSFNQFAHSEEQIEEGKELNGLGLPSA